MNSEDFKRVGYRLIDWIADYRDRVGELPVVSQQAPGSLRKAMPAGAPEQGAGLDDILADVERLLMPAMTHWQHPKFFAYFPSNADLASVLGDLLSSGLGVIGINWQANPALTELEEVMVDWLRQLLGLSEAFSGVIQDTASSSSLVALLSARERASTQGQGKGGLQAEPEPLVVYVSEQSHSSVEKAALLAGFGRDNVRAVPTDADYALKVDALVEAIEADRRAGRRPCAVVATVGTTTSTALDPVSELAELAQRQGLWLHVDAALAGTAMLLPECRWMWQGIERVDSLVLNPHKWLGTVFDLSVYYVRDAEHLVRVMSTNPSYLRTAADTEVTNYRDWGIPLGRRFRALKLWFLLREHGAEGLRTRLRRDLDNAQWLKEQVDAADDWERLAPVPLQTLCLRHIPAGLDGEALDAHTLAWAEAVNRSGKAYVTPAKLAGRWMVRVSIGTESTEREDVAALWSLMCEVTAQSV